MNNTTSITRKLKLGGLALVAAGSLALGAGAAEAAPSKAVVEQAAATAAKEDAAAASNRGKRSSERRKHCKAPKVAVRGRGRSLQCVRPKARGAVTIGGGSLVTTTNYYSPPQSISGVYFEERYMGCSPVYPKLGGGQYFFCYKIGYGAGNVATYRYSWFYKRASSSSAWVYWFECYC